MRTLTYSRLGNINGYEFFTLSPTPHEEQCTQASPGNEHDDDSLFESQVYARQLERVYGTPPPGAELFIMKNFHDFGIYYEAAVLFTEPPEKTEDDNHPELLPIEYALKLEQGCDHWDDIAKEELSKSTHHIYGPKQPAKVVKHQGKLVNIKSETA